MKSSGIVVLAAFLFAPQSQAASDDCSHYLQEIERRTYLSEEEKREWRHSPSVSWAFMWENDSFAKGGDKHYTNGMKLSWLRNPCRYQWRWHLWPEEFFKWAHGEGDPSTSKGVYYTGGVFGMNMYTPTNIVMPRRQRFDRPYVGWLYGGVQVQRQRKIPDPVSDTRASFQRGASADTLELQLGIIGPRSGQRAVQEWIHRDWKASGNFPQWDTQVADYPGFIAFYSQNRNYWFPNTWRPEWARDWKLDLRGSVFWGGALGNILRYGNAGAVLAFGNPGETFMHSTTIKPHGVASEAPVRTDSEAQRAEVAQVQAQSSTAEKISKRPYEWSVFVGTDHRYIAHSIFVQGRGEAAHDISLVHHVYDVFVGASFYLLKDFSLNWKQVRRSTEFTSSEPSVVKPHRIGQWGLEYRF